MCRRARPDSLSAPMADRISVFTLRIALNERSGMSKRTPVVPSSLLNLVPGSLSNPALCRDAYERTLGTRLLFADFCDGLHLSLFWEPVEIFSEWLPSGLYGVLPKFKFTERKKKTFKPVLTWSTGRYAPGYRFQRKPSSGLVIGRLLPLDGAVFSRQLDWL